MNKLCYCLLSFAVALTTMLASISCGEDEKENNSIVDEVSYSIIGTWKPVKYVYKDAAGFVQDVKSDESVLIQENGVYNFSDEGTWSVYYGTDVNSLEFDKAGNHSGIFYIDLSQLTLKTENGQTKEVYVYFQDKDTFVRNIFTSTYSIDITYERIVDYKVTEKKPVFDLKAYVSKCIVKANIDGTINISFNMQSNAKVESCDIINAKNEELVYSFDKSNEVFKSTNNQYGETPVEKCYSVDLQSINLPIDVYKLVVKVKDKKIEETFGKDYDMCCAYTNRSILGAYISLGDLKAYVMQEAEYGNCKIDFIVSDNCLKPATESKLFQNGRLNSYAKSVVIQNKFLISEAGVIATYKLERVGESDEGLLTGVMYYPNYSYTIDLSDITF